MSTEEFSQTLESLLAVKPPGVSGSKIRKLTQLAIGSVQSESVIVQKLYTHFKKTPVANKLGVLYVVDAIVRGLYDEAKKADQNLVSDAPEGTFAGGVAHIAFIIDGLIDDFVDSHQPVEIIEKALKVLSIWEKGGTFPPPLVKKMREKMERELRNQKESDGIPLLSTTPPGSPPAHAIAAAESYAEASKKFSVNPTVTTLPSAANSTIPSAKPDTASILQALANIAKQKQSSSGSSPNLNSGSIPNIFPLPSSSGSASYTPASVAGNSWEPTRSDRSRYNDQESHRRASRSRSPATRDSRSRSPAISSNSPNMPSKFKIDQSLPPGHVRVFSRTLFLGGLLPNVTEMEVSDTFNQFAKIQSIIFSQEKRHAFLKFFNRDDAATAKAKVDELNSKGRSSLRPRWGAGFGPRDCCDFPTGVSVIPLNRLSDSDLRWAATASNGGTGGYPLKEFMCIEEPDIAIGSGNRSQNNDSRAGNRDFDRERYRDRDHHRTESWEERRDNRGSFRDRRNSRDGLRDRGGREERDTRSIRGPGVPSVPYRSQVDPIQGELPSMANMPPGFQELLSSMSAQQQQGGPIPFPPFPFPMGSAPSGAQSLQGSNRGPQPGLNGLPFTMTPEMAQFLQQQKQNQK
ncbi:Nrd1 complex RNA-binding subunit [Sugiyamaella lignohabitans]|uniref:Nrd1 complex RNA-binding subunit n=1 Tax=Sugiyamaella lignohabitans TaxID=796027 RepID=A0A167E0P1_9ASCO|nr:Nrd1 complex RNA-binding subunit [Sugiyamaella lignohabitans]ANB13511.1 Nrd1 complex RNA-binding subunit [Sugiyamaella lignohabitans]